MPERPQPKTVEHHLAMLNERLGTQERHHHIGAEEGILLFDEGLVKGRIKELDFRGGSVTGSEVDGRGIVDISGGGGKEYATVVVASSESHASGKATADFVCDGVDDQVEINAALAAAVAGPGFFGGRVILLEGGFFCADTIIVPDYAWLVGMGPDATWLDFFDLPSGAGNDGIHLVDGFFAGLEGFSMYGANKTGQRGIESNDPFRARISHVDVYQFGAMGISLYGEQCIVTDCSVFGVSGSDSIGIGVLDESLVRDCIVDGVRDPNTIFGGIGISVEGDRSSVEGCIVRGCDAEGIYVWGEYANVSNNTVYDTEDAGIRTAATFPTVVGNTVVFIAEGGDAGFGIYIQDNYAVVSGNNVSETAGSGIYLEAAGGSAVNGNVVWTTGDADVDNAGIFATGCCNAITNNVIIDSATRGIYDQGGLNNISGNHLEQDQATGTKGIVLEGGLIVVEGNWIEDFAEEGIYNSSDNNLINGNYIIDVGGIGINNITGSHDSSIINNYILPDNEGIVIQGSSRCLVAQNRIISDLNGIKLAGADDCQVTGNFITGDALTADNTYDGILITSDSDTNNVQMNTVRKGAAIDWRYGINIDNSNCDDNFVTNNDLKNSGQTGSFNNAGTGTVTTAGNRL